MRFLKLFLTLVTVTFMYTAQSQQLTVGTYNLRYDNPKDTGNLWIDRAPVVSNLIRFMTLISLVPRKD
jgi:hypothetical protein